MFENLKKKGVLRGIGIVLVGGLIIWSWWLGWFFIVFYILGLYAAVYIISYLFKTTAIITFLLLVGGFIFYILSALMGLYLTYLVLQMMFTGSFLLGLLFLILLGTFGYYVPMAVALVLGCPLIFMSEDIEKRFPEVTEVEVLGKKLDETALEDSDKIHYPAKK